MRQQQQLLEVECELMCSSLTELNQITEQLKGIRQDALELEPSKFNLQDLITETLKKAESLIESEKIQVELQAHPILLVVSQTLLQETIFNIVVNAIDSMKTSKPKILTLETRVESDVLKFRISDTGVGIEPEILPKIYDPFFTTKVKGWGFGLYFVAQAMKYLKGKIEIESQPNQGTTVTLILPMNSAHS
jgi:signal transduction histidine kinase